MYILCFRQKTLCDRRSMPDRNKTSATDCSMMEMGIDAPLFSRDTHRCRTAKRESENQSQFEIGLTVRQVAGRSHHGARNWHGLCQVGIA